MASGATWLDPTQDCNGVAGASCQRWMRQASDESASADACEGPVPRRESAESPGRHRGVSPQTPAAGPCQRSCLICIKIDTVNEDGPGVEGWVTRRTWLFSIKGTGYG